MATAMDAKTEFSKQLAEYVTTLSFADIPATVIDKAKLFTLECIGHMVQGVAQPVSQILIDYIRSLDAQEQSVVVGAGLRTSAAEAAYVNGSFAHADELEAYGTLPGSGLIPPVAAGLAVGEWQAATSGTSFLAAIVAGIEMQGRLGSAGIGACDRGFMGISLVGTGGAAVTAGRLLGLDIDQMRNCLGVALPLSNGSTRGCGYMTHVHEAGVPARTGVQAAMLASKGFTGCPDYLDGPYSWGDQYAGGGSRPYRPDALTDGLGSTFFLETAGVAPKKYGSCGATHQVIEGTIELMREHDLAATDIQSIELRVPPFADRVASVREPHNGEQAKFSIRHSVAGLLVEGVPDLPYVTAFSDAAARDPRYTEARRRVSLVVDDAVPNVRGFAPQTVTMQLKDGRTLTKSVDGQAVRGNAANPLSLEERLSMFRNTAETLGKERVDRLVELVMGLEAHRVAEISELVATPA
jgi:2-methylcitrate dehydratase PrpD